MYKRYIIYLFSIITICCLLHPNYVAADQDTYDKRMALYKKTEATHSIPWYYVAAMDQYERSKNDQEKSDELIAVTFDPILWYGPGNISKDNDERMISLFGGIGRDGNGDGKAHIENDADRAYTIGSLLTNNGISEDDIKISLWQYYKRDLTVKTIINTAHIYRHFQSIKLEDRAFPVDINQTYSYNNTWGHRRGFGGNRIHEGTDIFAHYGTSVLATTYGVVELKGWNLYGGWRIGIRDIHNIYHYYAHLNSYEDDIAIGDIVRPGDVLGSVGSTGYGPPGTSGKFPPHLHYGMYKDNGTKEWSFDPYPYLKKWERMQKNSS